MRKTEFIMGMPISIDISDCDQPKIFDKTADRLREIDQQFSPYKSTSEVSGLRNGLLVEQLLSRQLKKIIRECKKAEKMTNGYFSAWAGGTFDPSGYIKGWAIAEAGKVIEKQGYKTYCIGAGGDILARSKTDKIWTIGIQDPQNQEKIVAQVSGQNIAVTTSGNYQRGAHIINPKTGQPADELLSVTIAGPDIIKADVLATAVFAMGAVGLSFMEDQKDYQALIINKAGQLQMTSGGGQLFSRSPESNL